MVVSIALHPLVLFGTVLDVVKRLGVYNKLCQRRIAWIFNDPL
jgi:hypothetical protein